MSKKLRFSLSVLLMMFMFVTVLPVVSVAESFEDDGGTTQNDLLILEPWEEDADDVTRDPGPGDDPGDFDPPPEAPPPAGEETEHGAPPPNPEQKEENDGQKEEEIEGNVTVGDGPIQLVDTNAIVTYLVQVEWLSDASLYASDSLRVEIIGRRASGQDVVRSLALTAGMGWQSTVALPVYSNAGGEEPEMYVAYGLVVASGQEGMACSVHTSGTTFIVSVTVSTDAEPIVSDTAPATPHEDDKDAKEDAEPLKPDMPEIPAPTIRLSVGFAGETMTKGTPVTITATIEGIPDGMNYMLQWRNDASGEFHDVPGETGLSVTFIADEWNVDCTWQLVLKVQMPEVKA